MSEPVERQTERIPVRKPPTPQGGQANGFAIASLVLAFFASVLSIVFGHVALHQIRRTGERGRGLALAGLWISYLGVAAALTVGAVVAAQAITLQNALTTASRQYATPTNGAPGTTTYRAPAAGPAPTTLATQPSPTQGGAPGEGVWAGPIPASSYADHAYCQNRGVLVRLGGSVTYRGALCTMNGQPTLVSFARDLGGNVTLPATVTASGFTATGTDGTTYAYTKDSVTITTPTRTFREATTLWELGSSAALAHPGDLGLSTPISYPPCDGSVVVIRGTAWHAATNADEVQQLLSANPGSSYLRTDLSCRSWAGPSEANSGQQYVYAVYTPAASLADACRQIASTGGYARWISNDRGSGDNVVEC